MVVFIEPISKNIDMYVPAYPLPLMEIASFVKSNIPGVDLGIISIPMDYGLPLTRVGRDQIYRELTEDIRKMRPAAVGISCTSISQAEEVDKIFKAYLLGRIECNILVFYSIIPVNLLPAWIKPPG